MKKEKTKNKEISPTIRILLIFIATIFVVAIAFSRLEGIGVFDSIYWVITTCSTVGYGDISPKTTMAKILTMFLMVSGVTLLGYLLSTMSDKLITFNMRKTMGLSKIKATGHVIIMGWNVVARMALDELKKMGFEVVIIDEIQHPELSSAMNAHFVLGSYHDESILKRAGIEAAAAIILAMESDSEVILAISSIRKINQNITLVGRIDDLDFADVARQAGCNRVVSPSEIGGNIFFSALSEPAVVRWFERATVFNCGVDLIDKIVSDEKTVNKTFGELDFGPHTKAIGVLKASKVKAKVLPEDSTTIEKNDTLITMIKQQPFEEGNSCKRTMVKKVLEGDVLLIGWNPTVRGSVNELLFSKKFTVTVLSDKVPVSEKEHYAQQGVSFIEKDIGKLSLKKALSQHGENVIVGIENDSDAILSSHIIRGLNADVNLIVRVDDPYNNDAAESIGANQMISPSVIGGHLLAHAIANPASVSLLVDATASATETDISEYTIEKGSKFDGAKVSDFKYDKRFMVVGIEREINDEFVVMPTSDEIMHAGDSIVFLHL